MGKFVAPGEGDGLIEGSESALIKKIQLVLGEFSGSNYARRLPH